MVDIGKTIHPHPTLGESVGLAAEVAHGTCTDLPPVRKKCVLSTYKKTWENSLCLFFLGIFNA